MDNWKKVFAIIWTGQLFSILSSSVVGFSLILWLSLKTGSAEVLALATLAALLPQSLLGIPAGVFIDRWNRKLTMILADTFIALCTLLLSVMFFLGTAEVWNIYLLLALRSAGSAFHAPAMQASVPLLAPTNELSRIAGINQVIFSLCNIAGPALGAIFIGIFDISYILLLDVGGAAIACIALLFVRIPNPERKEKTKLNIGKDLLEAWAGVRAVKGLSALLLFSVLATFVIMPAVALFPLMTLKHFMGDAFQIGIIEAVWGTGMLAGGGIVGTRILKTNKVTLINVTYLILGVGFFLSGLLPQDGFVWFAIFSFTSGVAGSIYYTTLTTLIQLKVAPEMLGRVFSAYSSINLLPSIVGLLATGVIADTIGIDTTIFLSGTAVCIIGVVSFFFPKMRELGKGIK